MTLPVSPNAISLSNVNVESLATATSTITMNGTAVRRMSGVTTSGATVSMSQLYGKSWRTPMTSVTHYSPDTYRMWFPGKPGTYDSPRSGTPLIGHPRWADQVSVNGGAIYTLPSAAWYNGYTITCVNNNPSAQKVNLSVNAFCGIWDTCNVYIYRVTPSQVYIAGVNSGHVPDWNIYTFNLSTTDTVPADTTYQWRVYMDVSYNGDYKYNKYAGGVYSMWASFNSWV